MASSHDARIWLGGLEGFSCKSFCQSVSDSNEFSEFEPFRFIWKSCVPHRIKVFAWFVFLGKINTCNGVQMKYPFGVLCVNIIVKALITSLLHCNTPRDL